jgi:hypothetical protein
VTERSPASVRVSLALGSLAVASSLVLLFVQLGRDPLWCDEADTVLSAQGILLTGDMTAMLGHNVYAFRNGCQLDDLKNRCEPPLPMYLVAASMRLFGETPGATRFPFALCGLACVLVMLAGLWRLRADNLTWLIVVLTVLGNTSFWLFARQSRYYLLAGLASTVAAYFYLLGGRRPAAIVGLCLSLLAMLATHYVGYFALVVTLALDYALWQRTRAPFSRRQWLALLGPQLVVGLVLVSIYNPLGRMGIPAAPDRNVLADRLRLLWWSFRDLNACEFAPLLLCVAGLFLAGRGHNVWLRRMAVAAVAYVAAVTIVSPQPVYMTTRADVRYLSPALPLFIALTAALLIELVRRQRLVGILATGLAVATNVLHQPWSPESWRSTPVEFARELTAPSHTAIGEATAWIQTHLRAGQSVWGVPGEQAYPLMFHAPQAIYGWQLDPPPQGQFAHLPAIQFIGMEPVDAILAFGPEADRLAREQVISRIENPAVGYHLFEVLDVDCTDGQRPELFWHQFQRPGRGDSHGVYIYRRTGN